MDDQRVPIGRFSAATRLSVKALRHHDEIGLLVPAETDPRTGYRYYRHGRMIAFLERLLTTDEAIMPYPITLETIPDRTIASVRFHTDLEQMPARLGDAFGQVAAAIHARGGEPAGAPLIVFHDVIDADEDGEIEVAIPCEGTHDPVDAVAFTRLPGGDAAVTTHRGPYLQVAPPTTR